LNYEGSTTSAVVRSVFIGSYQQHLTCQLSEIGSSTSDKDGIYYIYNSIADVGYISHRVRVLTRSSSRNGCLIACFYTGFLYGWLVRRHVMWCWSLSRVRARACSCVCAFDFVAQLIPNCTAQKKLRPDHLFFLM